MKRNGSLSDLIQSPRALGIYEFFRGNRGIIATLAVCFFVWFAVSSLEASGFDGRLEGWRAIVFAIVFLLVFFALIASVAYGIPWLADRTYRRYFRSPPWEKPFLVSRGVEADVFDALIQRLDLMEMRTTEWARLLRDRETGQRWREQTYEKASMTLEPVDDDAYQ